MSGADPSKGQVYVTQGKRFALFLLAAAIGARAPAAEGSGGEAAARTPETRPGSLDLILILDKSLSVAPFFDRIKAYAAGEILGPLLSVGDRLIVELVYGKTERLFAGTIESDADIARAVRAVREVVADGRFTDLGAALDAAKRDLDELGRPERTKYVLLLTDERQEAPTGSKYASADYRLRHPALEFVLKEDLGDFRAITIGFQVGERIASNAPAVLKDLAEPSRRPPAAGAEPSAKAAGGGEGGDDAAVPEAWAGSGSGASAARAGAAVPAAPAATTADPGAGQKPETLPEGSVSRTEAERTEGAAADDEAGSGSEGAASPAADGLPEAGGGDAGSGIPAAVYIAATGIALAAAAAALLLFRKKKAESRNER